MTSFTTLIVMVPMLIFAGDAIREFILPLMVGVLAGAYSSIATCSPLYYDFNRKANISEYEKHVKANTRAAKKAKKKETAVAITDSAVAEKPAETAENGAAAEEQASVKKAKSVNNQKRSKRYVKGNKK